MDEGVCAGCGACETYCRFGAIKLEGHATIGPISRESCGVCLEVCPVGAISLKERPYGEVFKSPEQEPGLLPKLMASKGVTHVITGGGLGRRRWTCSRRGTSL